MPRKRHTAKEIVAKLRQVDVLTSQGQPVAEAVRSIGVTEIARDELLYGEIFYTLEEAKVIIESWRRLCVPKTLSALMRFSVYTTSIRRTLGDAQQLLRQVRGFGWSW